MSTNEEKFVVDLSDTELEAMGLGSDAPDEVKETIRVIRKVPDQLKWLTVFHLQCLKDQAIHRPDLPASPIPPASTDATALSHSTETTTVEPGLVSMFERVHFYNGLSDDPPELLHRSDLLTRPFIIPNDRHSAIPEKTAHGVFDPILKASWRSTIAPEIAALLKDKKRGIHVATMVPVRFSTPDEDGKDVFGPIVIWISVHRNTTTEQACRDANPEILRILESHNVMDAAVHWIEGSPEPLVGPAMLRVANDTYPTSYVRRALKAVLGVPLAAEEMAADDFQGSLGIYFHEGKDKKGGKSERVFAVTNKHVVSKDTNTYYELGRAGAAKQWIRDCGSRRFQLVVNETRAFIAKKLGEATRLAEQLAELLAKQPSEDEAEDDKKALKRKQQDLETVNEDTVTLEKFLKDLNSSWSDAYQRLIGWVDWAPKISNDVDSRRYTRDIAVFELEKSKWEKQFKGNVVYLGGKYTPDEITTMFYPNVAHPPTFKYPKNHLYRLLGCLTAERLANPDFSDESGNPVFIVAKHGQTTDLTFGRFSELEAYTCNEFENESWEVAVFNYDKRSGNFSAKGDSGSCIFNAEGKMVAFLHSGMPRGLSSHVTFGTPAHFVINQIKEHYPHADFARLTFL